MRSLLEEGDVIELKKGHMVYADVPEHFVFSNKRGCFELTHHDVMIGGDFDYLVGRYVVYKTVEDGGSDGRDPYPDGHHVFCERLKDGVRVDFYQTGCFTAMIEDIKPVGKATRSKWQEKV